MAIVSAASVYFGGLFVCNDALTRRRAGKSNVFLEAGTPSMMLPEGVPIPASERRFVAVLVLWYRHTLTRTRHVLLIPLAGSHRCRVSLQRVRPWH